MSSYGGRSPSPSFSAPSPSGQQTWDSYDVDMTGSRPESPVYDEGNGSGNEAEFVTCQWAQCGKPFSHLPTLIQHIHDEHIGVNKSTYTCDWATCPRRGIQQASRFALISHIRAHTGEKPFMCPLPECDKSFTRSDAMAKHMRLQHGISAPLTGRGGNRKRKRDDNGVAEGEGYNAFKVEGVTPNEPPPNNNSLDDYYNSKTPPLDDQEYIAPRRTPSPVNQGSALDIMDNLEGIPKHLQDIADPETGYIHGRSPAMVRYLVMKAKLRYVMEQNADLRENLRVVRFEERQVKEEKEDTLDRVLRASYGAQAEFLVEQPHLPASTPLQGFETPYESNPLNTFTL